MKETLSLNEAAELCNASEDSISRIAVCGILPGAKIGKSWVFLRDDVMSYLREEINEQTAQRMSTEIRGRITRVR